MSGGRAEIGLGAGWYDDEHTAYGVPFQPLGERFERLEEQFAILTGLWDTPVGETFDFDGQHYQFKDSPGAAQARPAAAPAAHRRRRWCQADAAARCHLRGRVQPSLLVAGRHRGPVRPGPRRLRRTGGVTPRRCGCRRPRPSAAGPTTAEVERRAANIGRQADELRANGLAGTPDEVVARLQEFAGHRRAVGLPPGARSRRPRPHRRCSPRKCCPGSPDQGEFVRGPPRTVVSAVAPDASSGSLGTLAAGRRTCSGPARAAASGFEGEDDMTITSRGAVSPTSDQPGSGSAAETAQLTESDTDRTRCDRRRCRRQRRRVGEDGRGRQGRSSPAGHHRHHGRAGRVAGRRLPRQGVDAGHDRGG